MYGYIFRRILATGPVLGIVALGVFSLLHLAPGDPAALIAGDNVTPEQVEQIRQKLGLNLPFIDQFFGWLGRLAHGDLGVSIFSNRPVTDLFLQRIEPTVALAVTTLILTIGVAVPMGILAAWKAGSWIDRTVMGFAVLGFSVPVFVVGYIAIFVIAIGLGLLPVQGYVPLAQGFWPFFQHLILPSVALSAGFIALLARTTRASMLEVLNQDYIRTARAKGLAPDKVLMIHALSNAAVPIVTVIGIGVALLISGVVVTESVFAIPGLGRLTVDAILHRDYPVIQGVLLVFSGVYVIINLIIDLLYIVLDPRIRY
jgi:peptide/nickel transport system permease protein